MFSDLSYGQKTFSLDCASVEIQYASFMFFTQTQQALDGWTLNLTLTTTHHYSPTTLYQDSQSNSSILKAQFKSLFNSSRISQALYTQIVTRCGYVFKTNQNYYVK